MTALPLKLLQRFATLVHMNIKRSPLPALRVYRRMQGSISDTISNHVDLIGQQIQVNIFSSVSQEVMAYSEAAKRVEKAFGRTPARSVLAKVLAPGSEMVFEQRQNKDAIL